MRLVLDTNVWVDWLIFDDSSIAPIKAALGARRVHILANAACLDELIRVLTYSDFSLDKACQQQLLQQFHQSIVWHEVRHPKSLDDVPRCADPDDQKFVALAHDASVDWLLTRDKALLKLKHRLARNRIRVGSPVEWASAFDRIE